MLLQPRDNVIVPHHMKVLPAPMDIATNLTRAHLYHLGYVAIEIIAEIHLGFFVNIEGEASADICQIL